MAVDGINITDPFLGTNNIGMPFDAFEEFEFECATCHHYINAAKLEFPHENYFDDFWIDCKVCHHESGSAKLTAQSCSNCHHTLPTNIADETLSSKVVIHKNCWECHEVGTAEEASQNCKFCHTGPTKEYPVWASCWWNGLIRITTKSA